MTNAILRRAAAAVIAACAATAPAGAETLSGAYLAGRHAAALGDVRAAAERYAEALERDRDNPALMELAVVNMLAAGRLSDAAPIAARLVATAPQHRVGNLALAVESIAEGRFEGARERLESRPEGFYPLVGRLLQAWAAEGMSDVAGAEAALDLLDDRSVFRLFGGYHRGLIRAAAGDPAGAVEAFEAALNEIQAPTSRFALAYGASLEAVGRADAARALYERVIASAYVDGPVEAALARLEAGEPAAPLVSTAAEGAAEALFGVASVYANDSGRRLALVYARLATALDPGHAEAVLLAARLFEQEERFDLALAAYESAPDDPAYRARIETGRAGALSALGRDDAAAEALRALIAAEPDNLEARVALGDLLRRTEQWEAGAEAYSAAIELMEAAGRENWALFYQRGICYERAGLWSMAEPDFRKALEIEPEQPLVLNYLGYSLVEQRRALDEAKAMIERAVELRPEDGYITDSLGWVLYRLDDFDGAVEWLEKAVELAPYDPVINDHLGDAYWMVGREREAAFQWKRARSLEPEAADLVRIKRKLAVGLDVVLQEEAALDPGAAAADAREARPNGG